MLRFNICALKFILYLTNSHRAVFNWVSKRIVDCFSFALFRSVIGLENSHLSLNQSNAGTKNQSHLGQSRFPALPPGWLFLISHWTVMMLTFFFWLVVVITLVMLVDNHWSLFYFIVCYMPQKVSQRNAKRYLNSLWLSPSLKPVDQVLSKLSLKKTVCFATVNGWFWAKILLNKSSEKSQGLWLPPLCPTSSRGPQYEWSFLFFSIRLGLHRPYLTWSHWWC